MTARRAALKHDEATNALHSAVAVSAQNTVMWSKSSWLCGVGDSAGPRLQLNQIKDVKELREARAEHCRSASDRQCNQRMAQQTAILHCSWRRTFQTCTVNMTALLCALMLHAYLTINWILSILFRLDINWLFENIYCMCKKFLIIEQSTFSGVQTGHLFIKIVHNLANKKHLFVK